MKIWVKKGVILGNMGYQRGNRAVKLWLDVSLLGRDSGDFLGTLGTFVTLGTFQQHASGTIHETEFPWHLASYRR